MCFSAAASFTAAGVLAVAGAATLAQRPPLRLLPFALTPAIFAVHQAIEGGIWQGLADGAADPMLVFAWVFIAKTLWPIWTPAMVLAMESGARRRAGLIALAALGLGVGLSLFAVQLDHGYEARIVNGNLAYPVDHPLPESLAGLYLVVTVAPLFIARGRWADVFAALVLAGAALTELRFAHAGASVWCFFAAAASLAVLLHVREATRPAGQAPRRAPIASDRP